MFAAAYLLWLYQRTAMGEPNPEFVAGHGHGHAPALSAAANEHDDHSADIHDVTPLEWVAWTPFLIAIVLFGVYPQLLFKVLDPAVTALVNHVGAGIP